jgi:hypothetical protein
MAANFATEKPTEGLHGLILEAFMQRQALCSLP